MGPARAGDRKAYTYTEKPPPSNRIALAVIGTGGQAYHTNLPSLLAMPGVRVVAVCEVDRQRAEAAKAKVAAHYGDTSCRLFTDCREALAMPGLDAVMNSTPEFQLKYRCRNGVAVDYRMDVPYLRVEGADRLFEFPVPGEVEGRGVRISFGGG